MSIDFITTSGVAIPEGKVKKITNESGVVLWEANTPTAILYSDGTLVFQKNDVADTSHGDVVNTYTGWDKSEYAVANEAPWYTDRDKITRVSSKDAVPVKSTKYWFPFHTKLITADLSGLDTSNATDMSFAFARCSALTSLNLSGFDTGNVTDMSDMFLGCSALTSLNLSGFDTGNVTDMSGMFDECEKLKTLDLSGFDTSNVTNMNRMFSQCNALTSLDLSDFDTSNVTDMACMFLTCTALTSLDLSGFDTSNVTDMSEMFWLCYNLTSLDISSFNTSNVANMSQMFAGCSNSGFAVYVANSDMKTWVESTYGFPTTATVVIGSI